MSEESPKLNPETAKLVRWFYTSDGRATLLSVWLRGIARNTIAGLDPEDFVEEAMTALAYERHQHPDTLFPYPRLEDADLRPEPDFWAVYRDRRDAIRTTVRTARREPSSSLYGYATRSVGAVIEIPVIASGGGFPVVASARAAALDPTPPEASLKQARAAWIGALRKVRMRLVAKPVCVTSADLPACLAFLDDVINSVTNLADFDAGAIMPLTFDRPLDRAVSIRYGARLAFDSNTRKQLRRRLHHAFWRAVCELELPRSEQLAPLPGHALLATVFNQKDAFEFLRSIHAAMMSTQDDAFLEVHPRLPRKEGFQARHLVAASRQTLWHSLVHEVDPMAEAWPPPTDYALWEPQDV